MTSKNPFRKRLLLLSAGLFSGLVVLAQTGGGRIPVSGVVTDDSGETLIGASVIIKNTTQGTVTDLDGHYSITVPEGATLVFSSIGYKTVEVNVGSSRAKVVFYTGHDKYMLEAIRRQAFDYLLKPPTKQELSQIMTRYYEDKLTGIPSLVHADSHLPLILVVNALNEHLTLRLAECAFFRYNQERKVWEVVCMNGETYMLRHRTTSDVILNYSTDLVQIHKRYIVNVNNIKKIQDAVCILNEPLENNRELKISKNFKQELLSAFYSM